jgi:hypothetical protein
MFVGSALPTKCLFLSSQGQLLDYNESVGVLPDGQKLTLRGVVKESAGEYSCSAVNREGETRSSSVTLRVQCKCSNFKFVHPRCVHTCIFTK